MSEPKDQEENEGVVDATSILYIVGGIPAMVSFFVILFILLLAFSCVFQLILRGSYEASLQNDFYDPSEHEHPLIGFVLLFLKLWGVMLVRSWFSKIPR